MFLGDEEWAHIPLSFPSFLFSIFVTITQKPSRHVFIAHVILGSSRPQGRWQRWTEFTLIELSVGNPSKELIQNLLWGVCGLHFLNLKRKSAVLAFLKNLFWGLKLSRIQEAIQGREKAPNQTRSGFALCASDTGYYTVILIFLSEDLFPCYKMVVSLPTRKYCEGLISLKLKSAFMKQKAQRGIIE